jgi:hypothetical protein
MQAAAPTDRFERATGTVAPGFIKFHQAATEP